MILLWVSQAKNKMLRYTLAFFAQKQKKPNTQKHPVLIQLYVVHMNAHILANTYKLIEILLMWSTARKFFSCVVRLFLRSHFNLCVVILRRSNFDGLFCSHLSVSSVSTHNLKHYKLS